MPSDAAECFCAWNRLNCTHTHKYTHTLARTHARTRAHTHAQIHAHTRTHAHAHTGTRARAHTHARRGRRHTRLGLDHPRHQVFVALSDELEPQPPRAQPRLEHARRAALEEEAAPHQRAPHKALQAHGCTVDEAGAQMWAG
jgi:hypothetical protein